MKIKFVQSSGAKAIDFRPVSWEHGGIIHGVNIETEENVSIEHATMTDKSKAMLEGYFEAAINFTFYPIIQIRWEKQAFTKTEESKELGRDILGGLMAMQKHGLISGYQVGEDHVVMHTPIKDDVTFKVSAIPPEDEL